MNFESFLLELRGKFCSMPRYSLLYKSKITFNCFLGKQKNFGCRQPFSLFLALRKKWASKNTAGSFFKEEENIFQWNFGFFKYSARFWYLFCYFYSITDCIFLSINLFRVSYKYKKIRVKSRARCLFLKISSVSSLIFDCELKLTVLIIIIFFRGDLIYFFFWDTCGPFSGVVVDSISMLHSDGDVKDYFDRKHFMRSSKGLFS